MLPNNFKRLQGIIDFGPLINKEKHMEKEDKIARILNMWGWSLFIVVFGSIYIVTEFESYLYK